MLRSCVYFVKMIMKMKWYKAAGSPYLCGVSGCPRIYPLWANKQTAQHACPRAVSPPLTCTGKAQWLCWQAVFVSKRVQVYLLDFFPSLFHGGIRIIRVSWVFGCFHCVMLKFMHTFCSLLPHKYCPGNTAHVSQANVSSSQVIGFLVKPAIHMHFKYYYVLYFFMIYSYIELILEV